MRNIGLAAICVCALFSAIGCDTVKDEPSESYYEDAKVVQVIYTPPTHHTKTETDIEPRVKYDWVDGEFKTVWVPVNKEVVVQVPARYGVVFECKHGKFVVEGSADKHKELWGKMKEGMEVIVEYKEVYRNTYDGDKRVKSELVKLDFIGARPGSLKPELTEFEAEK